MLHIISCLKQRFGKFAEEALNSVEVDERIIQDDQILHDLQVLDTRNWILLDVMAFNYNEIMLYFAANIRSLYSAACNENIL